MTSWGARLAVFAIFLLGAACGGAAVHLRYLRIQSGIIRSEHPLADVMVLQLDRELDLDNEQERKVREIILQIREETLRDETMQATILPKVRELLDEGSARIAAVLDERQRARFEQLTAERRAILDKIQSPAQR